MAKQFTIKVILQKIDYLFKAVFHLENQLSLLNQNLLTVNEPQDTLENAVRVTGSLKTTKSNKISLSISQLVELYNDVPKILSAYIIKVSLTAQSYRKQTQGKIFLEQDGNGNYWIINTENDSYWLVPNINLRINIHKLKTLKLLFECKGKQSTDTSDFVLHKPARVSLISSGKEWKLEEQGELEFGNSSHLSKVQSELEQTKDERDQILFLLDEVNYERKELRLQIQKLQNRLEILEQDYNNNKKLQ